MVRRFMIQGGRKRKVPTSRADTVVLHLAMSKRFVSVFSLKRTLHRQWFTRNQAGFLKKNGATFVPLDN